MKNKMKPIHPGEILKDELEEVGFSSSDLACCLSVSVEKITSIINGEESISIDMALRLAKFFSTSQEFWRRLQTDFDFKIEIQKRRENK